MFLECYVDEDYQVMISIFPLSEEEATFLLISLLRPKHRYVCLLFLFFKIYFIGFREEERGKTSVMRGNH